MACDPSGRRVSFDPGDPPEAFEWDEDFCPICRARYPQEMLDAVLGDLPNLVALTTWPFCSIECRDKAWAEEARVDAAMALEDEQGADW